MPGKPTLKKRWIPTMGIVLVLAGCGGGVKGPVESIKAEPPVEQAPVPQTNAEDKNKADEKAGENPDGASSIKILFQLADAKAPLVIVEGLTAADVSKLPGEEDTEAWQDVLTVQVGGDEQAPAMLGNYRVDEQHVVFAPRFPFVAGLSYVAVFRPARLGRADAQVVKQEYTAPKLVPHPPAVVTNVYPSRSVLPENQLKFYLHFSAPMSQGEAYDHIQLLRENGEEVKDPFLEVGEELWDRSGTRLTLLFDPGRIKRGLKPREEVGPSIEQGKSYVLVVDRGWPDAKGQPLKDSLRKPFKVVGPDDVQPDIKTWKIEPPQAGDRSPLTLTFPEPLDQAMLVRVLVVRDAGGEEVVGKVEVGDEETRWRFVPQEPWAKGEHRVDVDAALEDLAGNSIARPFEVDVAKPVEKTLSSELVSLKFQVAEPE